MIEHAGKYTEPSKDLLKDIAEYNGLAEMANQLHGSALSFALANGLLSRISTKELDNLMARTHDIDDSILSSEEYSLVLRLRADHTAIQNVAYACVQLRKRMESYPHSDSLVFVDGPKVPTAHLASQPNGGLLSTSAVKAAPRPRKGASLGVTPAQFVEAFTSREGGHYSSKEKSALSLDSAAKATRDLMDERVLALREQMEKSPLIQVGPQTAAASNAAAKIQKGLSGECSYEKVSGPNLDAYAESADPPGGHVGRTLERMLLGQDNSKMPSIDDMYREILLQVLDGSSDGLHSVLADLSRKSTLREVTQIRTCLDIDLLNEGTRQTLGTVLTEVLLPLMRTLGITNIGFDPQQEVVDYDRDQGPSPYSTRKERAECLDSWYTQEVLGLKMRK